MILEHTKMILGKSLHGDEFTSRELWRSYSHLIVENYDFGTFQVN